MNGSTGREMAQADTPERRHRMRVQCLRNQASSIRSTAKSLTAQYGDNSNWGIKRRLVDINAKAEALATDIEGMVFVLETLNRTNPEG